MNLSRTLPALALSVSVTLAAPALAADANTAQPADAKTAQPADAKVAHMEHGGLNKIQHIVVIYLENHSFDNLFGLFPGADGLLGRTGWPPQLGPDGKPYATLPPVMNTDPRPKDDPNKGKPIVDPDFPTNLINAPFRIDQYVPLDKKTHDIVHKFYQNQAQIDGGKNDKFVQYSDAQALSYGFYDIRGTKIWKLAQEYTLADHFFMGAFGGSFLNHQWTICACTPVFPNAPDAAKAHVDDAGTVTLDGKFTMSNDGQVTPDGYAVNTIYSVFQPHPAGSEQSRLLPAQTAATIGDRLSDKGISWTWYSGGWNDAIGGDAAKTKSNAFQFHHQPFAYFAKYGDGTPGRAEHLKDETDLDAAIDNGTLPAVVYYKPVGIDNQHPGYADVSMGDEHTAQLVDRIRKSKLWKSTVIIITYDENGGFWDHVAPPGKDKGGDRWGPGSRVPALIVSPFARKHFVDHTVYDTTAILRLIEERYGLEPLGGERKFPGSRNDLRNALVLK